LASGAIAAAWSPCAEELNWGAFLIDTAEIYGTEEAVAEAIGASVIES
jgi:diketogulonate reductase-like aldo/keto reductase